MIVGLDLGGNFGYAVLDHDGNLETSGYWKLGTRCGESLYRCFFNLQELFTVYAPSAVGYEQVFGMGKGHSSRFSAHAYGGYEAIVLMASHLHGIQRIEKIAVATIKKVATGYGKAEKFELQSRALEIWGVDPESSDEADAIWCAECVRRKLKLNEHKQKKKTSV